MKLQKAIVWDEVELWKIDVAWALVTLQGGQQITIPIP
jgi:hypothetical protein